MNVKEYSARREALLSRYEKTVREWLNEQKIGSDISDLAPFYRDGVVCPEKWFAAGNQFRPLFILKEVSAGIDTIDKLPEYVQKWGRTIEFVENPFEDIQVGSFSDWKRIAMLSSALESVSSGQDIPDYSPSIFAYTPGEPCPDAASPYSSRNRTANTLYKEAIEKIAVINIKKLAGGTSACTGLSLSTCHYSQHIVSPLAELLYEQIRLIDPSVVVCCGRHNGQCISKLLTDVELLPGIWIDGYHPNRSSTDHFYKQPAISFLGQYSKS